MRKNYTLVSAFWHSQKIFLCSVLLFQCLTGFSQTTSETKKNEQIKTETPIFSSQNENNAGEIGNQTNVHSTAITPNTSTSAVGNATINTSTSRTQEVVIDDETAFPKYIETGDPIKDSENYASRKQKWIEQNPEAYQQLINPKK